MRCDDTRNIKKVICTYDEINLLQSLIVYLMVNYKNR